MNTEMNYSINDKVEEQLICQFNLFPCLCQSVVAANLKERNTTVFDSCACRVMFYSL